MNYQLNFEKIISYDLSKNSIEVDVTLGSGSEDVSLSANIDTGASFCICERKHGEHLGLEIESGLLQRVATVTGGFTVYGFSLTLRIIDFEFDSFVYFAADRHFSRNVLGRIGWLDKILIGTNDYEGKLYPSKQEWL